MKNISVLLRKVLKRSKQFYIKAGAGLLGIIIVSISVYAMTQESTLPSQLVSTGEKQVEEKPLETIQPILLSNSSSTIILGSILSNEIANIYSRRDGIVEDIYVDIGDIIQKNQVVALLLPKGVEGQSAAVIAEKNARKVQAEADYVNTVGVAGATINNAQQQIEEKHIELQVALSEQKSLIRMFEQHEANINQAREQTFVAIRRARQIIEQIFLGSNSRAGATIDVHDMNDQLGLLDPQTRYDVIAAFLQLEAAEEEFISSDIQAQSRLVDPLIEVADSTLSVMNEILAATPTVPNPQRSFFTEQDLTQMTNRILTSQDNIYTEKEKLEDAINAYSTFSASEPSLFASWQSGSDLTLAESNAVQMIRSQLNTSQQNLILTESQQQKIIENGENMVGIANAMLNAEYARSGHRKILSPFTGVVSKRFINVGQLVMPSMTAFELTEVPTSLAKKAKSEVQFGLPEHLQDAVSVGDTVVFFLPNDEGELHTAEVTRKSPQVDMQSHTIIIQAKIDDALRLPHNTSVRVRIIDQSLPLFRVPSFAVKRDGENNIIWVLDPETENPLKVFVSVRSEDGEFAEITGDLSEETLIILDPPDLITQTSIIDEFSVGGVRLPHRSGAGNRTRAAE